MNTRIAKFISSAGFCSRREAEKLILDNKVFIIGELCKHPSKKVNDQERIKISNRIIKKNKIPK